MARQGLDVHRCRATVQHAEPCGCGIRQVDDTILDKGPPIVDLDDDRITVIPPRHSNKGRYRQVFVRSGQLIHVIDLAAGRPAPMKFLAIPAGDSGFPEALG